jgi:hypothetical protein
MVFRDSSPIETANGPRYYTEHADARTAWLHGAGFGARVSGTNGGPGTKSLMGVLWDTSGGGEEKLQGGRILLI